MTTNKTALLIGATGLTGMELLHQLLAHTAYSKVKIFVRRPIELKHPKLEQVILDFDQPEPALFVGDDLFCAMGTTLAKAGSKEAQYKIDCTYPAEIGRMARSNGVKRYLLVSSVGADKNSGNFYLRTKGELEQKILDLHFDRFIAARPSFLLGKREETRIGERIGIVIAKLIAPLLVGGLRKYRGTDVHLLATTLIRKANDQKNGTEYPEYDAFFQNT